MKRTLITGLVVAAGMQSLVMAQGIKVPTTHDKYAEQVAKAERGDKDVDYREMRFAYIERDSYPEDSASHKKMNALREQMWDNLDKCDWDSLKFVCQQILSLDYTNLYAQHYLTMAFRKMGDSANYHKYNHNTLGLLSSIINGNNGKSCEKPWEAAQVSEEYYILRSVLGAKVKSQTLLPCDKYICDQMDVIRDSVDMTYYFDVTRMMEASEKKLNEKK